MFKAELTNRDKTVVRRSIVVFAVLINVFLITLAASYGFDAWRGWRSVRGALQVTVSGEGKVSARPDVARVTATVLTEGRALSSAQEENSRKAGAVTAYLKGKGVTDKDIKTSGYNIFPQYVYPQPCRGDICPLDQNLPRIVGYQVRSSYEVTVRDLGAVNDILGGVVEAGVNEIGGIIFTIDKPDDLKAEARKLAIENAKEKAAELAGDLGRRLGRVVSFTEGGAPGPVFRAEFETLGGKGGDGFLPSVEPGENEVVVGVLLTYELK